MQVRCVYVCENVNVVTNPDTGALQFVRRKHVDWKPKIHLLSSRTGEGLDAVISDMQSFRATMTANGALEKKRLSQQKHWMWSTMRRLAAQVSYPRSTYPGTVKT